MGFCPSVLRLSSSGVLPSSLFQVPLVALDGLFDAQQQRGVPLVQAGDGVELFHLQGGVKKNATISLLFGVQSRGRSRRNRTDSGWLQNRSSHQVTQLSWQINQVTI